MYELGKIARVVAEMKLYNIIILELRETQWKGASKKILGTGEKKNVLHK